MPRFILAALLGLCCVGFLRAAPPTLTQLFPAGGQRGQTVNVAATGTFDLWPVQAWADSPHLTITAAKESGRFAVAIAADATPGTHWVRLFNKDGASELRPFLVGNLVEVVEKEPNDDFTTPHALPTPSVIVNGKLEKPGDVDCFALKLLKGATLVAALEAQQTLRSPMDGVLQILNQDGFVLEQNNDYHGMDPQIVFRAPHDGVYLVRTFAFPAKPDSGIRYAGGDKFVYRLTIATSAYADHAFPLAVEHKVPGQVALVGWNVPAAAAQVMPQPKGASLALAFHPLVANAVPVRLEPHPITVKTDTPTPLTLPTTVSGILGKPGTTHAFPFAGKKGQKLLFQVESRTLGFPLDPVLQVTDAKGKVLAAPKTTPLNTDPSLSFTVPADGTYRVEVRDFHDDGGPRFVYRLRAVFAEPDFAITAASDRITLTPGKPLDLALAIDRRNGFKGDLDFQLDGLPQGVMVKLEMPKSAAADKTATLRLTASNLPTSAAVRIVARATSDLAHTVRGSGAEPGWASEDLWLTILPAKK